MVPRRHAPESILTSGCVEGFKALVKPQDLDLDLELLVGMTHSWLDLQKSHVFSELELPQALPQRNASAELPRPSTRRNTSLSDHDLISFCAGHL